MAAQKKTTLQRNHPPQRQSGRRCNARSTPQQARFQSAKKANHTQGMTAAKLRSSAGLVAMAIPTRVALIGMPLMARTPNASGCHHKHNSHSTNQARQGRVNKVRKTAVNNKHSNNRSTNSVPSSNKVLRDSSHKKFGRFISKTQAAKNAVET